MSKVVPIVNGENTGGGDANVNMVALLDSRSSKTQDFGPNQDKCTKIYTCEVDHMYASVNDGTCTPNQGKDREIKHLKELLLLHLDLIQQQSEQIVTKDKQLATLKQEYETLKMRFDRMERRVTLQKHKDISELPADAASASLGTSFDIHTAAEEEEEEEEEEDNAMISCDEIPLRRKGKRLSQDKSGSGGDDMDSSIGWRKRRVSEGGIKCVLQTKHKKRTTSTGSDKSKLPDNFNECSNSYYDETDKRVRERLKLKTEYMYYTIIGESNCCWSTVEPTPEPAVTEDHVMVPSWRERPLMPCYVMEGTENLDDDVFNKRHNRLEVDERRRKRWDIQRIREQHHLDKLKQKQLSREVHSRASAGSEHLVKSLFPSIEDLQEISIQDKLPVVAFGMEMPLIEHSDFSLPWASQWQCKQVVTKGKSVS